MKNRHYDMLAVSWLMIWYKFPTFFNKGKKSIYRNTQYIVE